MNIGLDLDGTVYRSQEIIPGCSEAILELNEVHNIIFLTNNGSISPSSIIKKLEDLLKIKVRLDNLVTPLNIALNVLSDHGEPIYIHGNELIKNYMRDLNLNINDSLEKSSILLIGNLGNYTDHDIDKYSKFHSQGNKVFTFNKDMSYPTADGFEVGTGVLVAEIEKHTNAIIESFGKPSNYYLEYLIGRYDKFNYIVGDRIDTDMLLGQKLGSKCILLESGVYQAGEPLPDSMNIKVYKNLSKFTSSL